ncbi:hypothetical protein ckrop_1347 [Corynebacterium kroppenstedtii DSM 44385]|uniref:Uncharacterized protein n=1 Tax=Corynebacterium kroppenstedtii (strain DSM 44385 / JCM 11950 / CIP 105744 / CCUG 35717) TaxID=645127 RepID=C4LJT4_CORK4|nr:hypothetical protein ckrop_1347 [Corynebacterium kroppenstedtii DSM 44385]
MAGYCPALPVYGQRVVSWCGSDGGRQKRSVFTVMGALLAGGLVTLYPLWRCVLH